MKRQINKNTKIGRALIKWKNTPWNDKVFLFIVYGIIAAITLSVIYPVYWTVIASFSDP